MIALRGGQQTQLHGKTNVSEFKAQSESNTAQIKADVSNAFEVICQAIEQVQKKELSVITSKQNDMYQVT
jgi:hypothetical protein